MPNIEDFKCPNCGGAIQFDPTAQKLKCPYCDCEFDVQAVVNDQQTLGEDQMKWESISKETYKMEEEGVVTYVCRSCGGSIICDTNTAATECPYCGNQVVLSENVEGVLKPQFIIPFKLTRDAAKQKLKEHLSKKFFLPKVFKQENHLDNITGIYVPFWLFDADTDARIKYRATITNHWEDSEYEYTKTSYYSCFRAGGVGFEHIPVDGSSKMPDDLMESVEPFDYNEAVPFSSAYFAGFVADKYDVTQEDSLDRANQRIKTSTEDALATTVNGYDTVTAEDSSVIMKNGRADYAMYPVYILNTTWKDQKYIFAMNGQTGKFVGNLPMDTGKFVRTLLGIGIGASAIIYGVCWLFALFGGGLF